MQPPGILSIVWTEARELDLWGSLSTPVHKLPQRLMGAPPKDTPEVVFTEVVFTTAKKENSNEKSTDYFEQPQEEQQL